MGDLSHKQLMSELDTLLSDIEAYSNATGLSTATLSRKLLGDGTRYDKLRRKEVGLTLRTLNRAKQRLAEMQQGEAA